MGLRAYVAREIAALHAKNAFVQDGEGRRFYVPGGTDNLFSRRAYAVPDDETAQRIARLERPWFIALAGSAVPAFLLVALGATFLKQWVPWSVPIAGTVFLLAFYALFPIAIGTRIARGLGLQARPGARTMREVVEGVGTTAGPTRSPWIVVATAVVLAGFFAWALFDAVRRGDDEFYFLAILATPLIFVFMPLYAMSGRARQIAEDNVRLEAVVVERTSELREANARLQAQVEEQVVHLERLGQLRHFFAAPVAEMIIDTQGFDPARVHRKELSVISVDLRGFTTFAESVEPEEVIAVLREYHTRLGELVNRYAITLEHFAGESAMLFLNDPLDAPDHPRRAVAFACDLRDCMRPQLVEWRSAGYDLGLGIGIASGFATIGTVGYEGRWEYAAIGTVCNLAARLCGEAGDGAIVTTHRVVSRVGEGVRAEPIGELALKGITRPVACFNVLSLA